jgi:hypothetical protein
MARYAEWNKFIQNLKTDKYGTTDVNEVGIAFEKATADVVPKSEVDRLENEVKILTENSISTKYPHCVLCSRGVILTKSLEDYDELIGDISSSTKQEVAREIFEEIDEFLVQNATMQIATSTLHCKLAELKKKYTEGKNG